MPLKLCQFRSLKGLLRQMIELGQDAHSIAHGADETDQAARFKSLISRIRDELNDVERRLAIAERSEVSDK